MADMNKREISFRLLVESNFPCIHHWFNKLHVQAFYSLRSWTLEDVYKKFVPCLQGERLIKGFIIDFEKHPIVYIQSYPIQEHPWENQNLTKDIIHIK
jgi:hypothetical protein